MWSMICGKIVCDMHSFENESLSASPQTVPVPVTSIIRFAWKCLSCTPYSLPIRFAKFFVSSFCAYSQVILWKNLTRLTNISPIYNFPLHRSRFSRCDRKICCVCHLKNGILHSRINFPVWHKTKTQSPYFFPGCSCNLVQFYPWPSRRNLALCDWKKQIDDHFLRWRLHTGYVQVELMTQSSVITLSYISLSYPKCFEYPILFWMVHDK